MRKTDKHARCRCAAGCSETSGATSLYPTTGVQISYRVLDRDVAIDMYLTALERAQKVFPRLESRPTITHCKMINDDLVQRVKALDAVPALFTTHACHNSHKFTFYGQDLMKWAMAFRTLLDAAYAPPPGRNEGRGPIGQRLTASTPTGLPTRYASVCLVR